MGRKRSRICVRSPICVEVCIQSDLGRRAARSAPGHAARIVAGLHVDAMHPALGVAVADLPPDGGRRVLAQDEAPVRVAVRNEADHSALKDGLRGDLTARVPGRTLPSQAGQRILDAVHAWEQRPHMDQFTWITSLCTRCATPASVATFLACSVCLRGLKPYVEQEITRLNDERLKALDWQEGSGRGRVLRQTVWARRLRTESKDKNRASQHAVPVTLRVNAAGRA